MKSDRWTQNGRHPPYWSTFAPGDASNAFHINSDTTGANGDFMSVMFFTSGTMFANRPCAAIDCAFLS